MGLLTKQAVIDVEDIKQKEVEVEAWGGSVRLKQLNALEVGRVRQKTQELKLSEPENMCEALALALIDEEGKPVFDDAAQLLQKNGDVILKLYLELIGMSAKDKTDEELVKNSPVTQSESSPSS